MKNNNVFFYLVWDFLIFLRSFYNKKDHFLIYYQYQMSFQNFFVLFFNIFVEFCFFVSQHKVQFFQPFHSLVKCGTFLSIFFLVKTLLNMKFGKLSCSKKISLNIRLPIFLIFYNLL